MNKLYLSQTHLFTLLPSAAIVIGAGVWYQNSLSTGPADQGRTVNFEASLHADKADMPAKPVIFEARSETTETSPPTTPKPRTQVNVSVNGQAVEVPQNGTTQQTITASGSTTDVRVESHSTVSIDGRSSSTSSSHSSTDIYYHSNN